jgi:hypothetical protein
MQRKHAVHSAATLPMNRMRAPRHSLTPRWCVAAVWVWQSTKCAQYPSYGHDTEHTNCYNDCSSAYTLRAAEECTARRVVCHSGHVQR